MSDEGAPCCTGGECCGPGSYCCARTGPHEHPEVDFRSPIAGALSTAVGRPLSDVEASWTAEAYDFTPRMEAVVIGDLSKRWLAPTDPVVIARHVDPSDARYVAIRENLAQTFFTDFRVRHPGELTWETWGDAHKGQFYDLADITLAWIKGAGE